MNRIDELTAKLENTYNSPIPSNPKAKYEIDREKGKTTMELSFAIAQSVLSKLLDPQGTTADLKTYKIDPNKGAYITDDSGVRDNIRILISALAHEQNRIIYGENIQNTLGTNNKICDGDYNGIEESAVNGKTTTKRVADIDGMTYSDGMELVSAANKAIMEEIAKSIDRAGKVDLHTAYDRKKLEKRVYLGYTDITEEDLTYTMEHITPIEIVFKSVRNTVKENASLKIDNSKYCYMSEVVGDESIYRRMPKALTYTITDCNGGMGEYYTELLEAVDRTNLTARQSQILSYRYDGIGIDTIGKKLGVSKQAVHKNLTKIRDKVGGGGYYAIIEKADHEKAEAKTNHALAHDLHIRAYRTRKAIDRMDSKRALRKREERRKLLSVCNLTTPTKPTTPTAPARLINPMSDAERRERGVKLLAERCAKTAYRHDYNTPTTPTAPTAEKVIYSNGRFYTESMAENAKKPYMWNGKNYKYLVADIPVVASVKDHAEYRPAYMGFEKAKECAKKSASFQSVLGYETFKRKFAERAAIEKARGAERERAIRERTKARREKMASEKFKKEIGLA